MNPQTLSPESCLRLQDRYTYPWKTEKSWAGSCRQVVVRYTDGTTYRANFNFVK
ncbi:PxKF domain-containing protein [Meiothermus rufus]|uniref:PxKF domain-containing protein n=1 Tax=Meiothermus rufus TaxID=604332 RepID=UPI0012EB8ED7|nr:PxKF domain-containing protein [Meiothermus rufus]